MFTTGSTGVDKARQMNKLDDLLTYGIPSTGNSFVSSSMAWILIHRINDGRLGLKLKEKSQVLGANESEPDKGHTDAR